MRIIPAIDILGGKCVRLTKGNYNTTKVYAENPVEIAKRFEVAGFQHLHVVDLDGARNKKIVNHKVLRDICNNTSLKVDFGGGIKSNHDLKIAFESGANQVIVGSIAVSNQALVNQWLQQFGSYKIILGADFENRKVATLGWQKISSLDVIDFIKQYEANGIKYVLCTDISKDGMLEGTSNDIYREIIQQTSVKLIASGGVSSIHDLELLQAIGCEAAVIGKAIFEGRISLTDLSTFNSSINS